MLVLIEGNISASKSTVVNGLDGEKFFEPLEAENEFLERFYADPKRYAADMQYFTLIYRYKQWKLAQAQNAIHPDEVYLLDRSLFLDHAFAKVNHDLGTIEDCEYRLYKQMHEVLQEQIYFPDLCLWLRVSPEVCLERLRIRARGCEVGVTLDYLERLEEAYCECMETLSRKCPVIQINADQSREQVLADCASEIASARELGRNIFPRWKGGY
jgi:deoxyadenosine/deoxycytidine kinase